MKVMVKSILNGREYIIDTESGEVLESGLGLGIVPTIKQLSDNLVSEISSVEKEIKTEYEEFKNIINNKSLSQIYSYANKRSVLSRFESVRLFSEVVKSYIEVLAEVDPTVQLFTEDKKLIFIKNLSDIIESLGYKLEITDFSIDRSVEMIIKGENFVEVIKIDDDDYDKIQDDSVLRELLKRDTIAIFLSEDKKRAILRKVIKLFKKK